MVLGYPAAPTGNPAQASEAVATATQDVPPRANSDPIGAKVRSGLH